jgi:signal transduction histidine kinase
LQLNGIVLDKKYGSTANIHGFPVELKQVFLNLIGNAVQAMPEGGRLRIHVHESTDWKTISSGVCISVCDTGSGIPSEHAKRLFEPFFSTKSTKGTGLGLWISKGIIQKYEGTIRFRTVKLFGGNATCFRVFSPNTAFAKKSRSAATYSEVAR